MNNKNNFSSFNSPRRCIACNEYTAKGVLINTADLGKRRCVCPNCAVGKTTRKADPKNENVLTLSFIVDVNKLPELEDGDTTPTAHIKTAIMAKFHYRRHNGAPVGVSAAYRMNGKEGGVYRATLSLAYTDAKADGTRTRQDPRRPLHGLEEQGFKLETASGYRVGKGTFRVSGEGVDTVCNLWAKGWTYPTL